MRRAFRILAAAFVIAVIASGVQFAAAPQSSRAANANDFNPGNIISDDVFYNANTMDEGSIQAFLNAMVPNCSPGATCLKNFSQTTYSRAADPMCSAYSGAPNESAARIIFKVAQACGINPQVILVTLQKEQVLVTSTYPSSWAWQASMGYACPDTSACDTQYYGFYNQVYMGSWQLKRYGNPPGTSNYFTWFPVGGYANVLYNPDAGCGSSSVYIANKATAALYYYTPYQPKASALAAGYGASSDPCASYGNRNFFLFFTDWFGSTGNAGIAYIDALYASLGGAGGSLGPATTGYTNLSQNGGGMVRGYTNGAIAWTKAYGAAVVSGPIRDYFNAQGGIGGRLGWPVGGANGVNGGLVQGFMGGAITYTDATGPRLLTGTVRNAFNAAGGLSGPMGWPTGDVSCSGAICTQDFQNGKIAANTNGSYTISSPKIEAAYSASGSASGPLGKVSGSPVASTSAGGGLIQVYEKGVITSTATAGAHPLYGAVRAAHGALGGIAGYLGWPSGDLVCDASKNCSQTFQGGTIFLNADGTTSAMSGPILSLFTSSGGATGKLGAPVGSTYSSALAGGGLIQAFASGAITWTSRSGAVALTGDIRAMYNALGGVAGPFGWPATGVSDYAANGGGSVQGFDSGAIAWTKAYGAVPLSGVLRTAYGANGGVSGPLGWPAAGQTSAGGGLVQAFQNGALVYSASTGAHALMGAFRTAYATTGGIGGTFGWPVTDVVGHPENGGGSVQAFQNGAITVKGTGGPGILLFGPIRSYFNANGGLGGALGWPVANQVCAPDLSCTQKFDGGTVVWSPAAGGSVKPNPAPAP